MGAELRFCSPSELGSVSKAGKAEGALGRDLAQPWGFNSPMDIVSRSFLGPFLHPPPAHSGQCLVVPTSHTRGLGSPGPSHQ